MSSMTSRNRSATKNSRYEWHSQLAGYLGPDCFPARGDQLLAALISRRCPSSLLWHLSSLPQSRRYTSVDEVIAAGHGAPKPPQGWD